LTASTAYHYQVKSQDSSSNVGVAADKTFTTLAAGQTASAPTSTTPVTQKPVSQMTREELIAFILQLIAAMQTGGTTTGGNTAGISGIPATFTFQNNLAFGIEMIDVKYLQIVLNSNADTKVSLTGAGSSGYETTRFGNATLAAVKKFQTKYGIVGSTSVAYGLVGPATRAKLNNLIGK
jgi:peptidoglycan hydrolase-like protein with peptidoglycan-binding domain